MITSIAYSSIIYKVDCMYFTNTLLGVTKRVADDYNYANETTSVVPVFDNRLICIQFFSYNIESPIAWGGLCQPHHDWTLNTEQMLHSSRLANSSYISRYHNKTETTPTSKHLVEPHPATQRRREILQIWTVLRFWRNFRVEPFSCSASKQL